MSTANKAQAVFIYYEIEHLSPSCCCVGGAVAASAEVEEPAGQGFRLCEGGRAG